MKRIVKGKIEYLIILALIIILQLFRVVYVFNVEKEGFHSDEIWCYGLANGYYNPFIFTKGNTADFNTSDKRQNFNEWLSSDVYRNYIEVGDDDRFAYDSVLYNQAQDQLPPLHYIVLHTICSFFPNTFSWWYGLSINLFALILVDVFLYKLARCTIIDKKYSLLAVALYAFTIGSLQTFMFIRMYALVTMFLVMLTYYHAYMLCNVKYSLKTYLALAITTMLGGLTHYVFLFYAFFLAAMFCFYLLLSRKIKRLFGYAVSMLIGVAGILAVFPQAIDQLTRNRGNARLFPTRIELAYMLNRVFFENTGIVIPVFKNYIRFYVYGILFVVIIFTACLLFVFRNEKWLHRLTATIKTDIQKGWKKRKIIKNRRVFLFFTLILGIFAEIIVSTYICNIVSMGVYSDRYLFCIYPVFCLMFTWMWIWIIKKMTYQNCNKWTFVVITVFVLMSNALCVNNYIFPTERGGQSIKESVKDADVILGVSADWLLVTFPEMLMDANQVFNFNLVDWEKLNDYIEKLPDDGKSVYLVLDVSIINKMLELEATGNNNDMFMGMTLPNGAEYEERIKDCPYTFEDIAKTILSIDGVEVMEEVGVETIFSRLTVTYKLR